MEKNDKINPTLFDELIIDNFAGGGGEYNRASLHNEKI